MEDCNSNAPETIGSQINDSEDVDNNNGKSTKFLETPEGNGDETKLTSDVPVLADINDNFPNQGECPLIDDITADNMELPYDRKLEIFEKDVQTLYGFAVRKGFSSEQIRSCLSPLLGEKKSVGKRVANDSCKSIFILSLIVAVIACLWALPFSQKLIIVHSKLLSIKTIPFWDWTTLYHEDCLIYNPYLPPVKNLTEEDCFGCLEFKKDPIDRLENVTANLVTDEYLYADIPYIVVDADRYWPKETNGELRFNLDRLVELMEEHPVITESANDCEFFSTMENIHNISQFSINLVNDTLPDKFHVSWENCDPSAAKVFRLLAPRPFFIPPMAEASPHNQLVISKGNFEGHSFGLPQQIDSATWMISLYGEFNITLRPHEECLNFKCNPVSTFILTEGEAVVVPSRIWNMTYSPLLDTYTLAFASTVVWDDVI